MAAVGTVLSFEALFSCEFVLVQVPCVQAIVFVWIKSMERHRMQDAETGVGSQGRMPTFTNPLAGASSGLVSQTSVKKDHADEGEETSRDVHLSQSTLYTSECATLVIPLPTPPRCYAVSLPPRKLLGERGSNFAHPPIVRRSI
ncbi:hypothetical protein AX16_004526 [Volvariella volvacea WC 439]|nr:hypothetical protein AX16_004526 [Volvariella volvacea WC 439]